MLGMSGGFETEPNEYGEYTVEEAVYSYHGLPSAPNFDMT